MSERTSYRMMTRGEGKQTRQLLTLQRFRACTECSTCTATGTCEPRPRNLFEKVHHCAVGSRAHECLCDCPLTFSSLCRWYTQQNAPRARTYSWSRNLRPGLDHQQRPGSAPLYGRLCYGIHTLPVLRDCPVGPLEAGVQLTQLPQGHSGGYMDSSLLIQNQRTFDPLPRSADITVAGYVAEHMQAKSKAAEKSGNSESTADSKLNQDQAKVRATTELIPQMILGQKTEIISIPNFILK